MAGYIKSAGLIAAFLVIFFPCPALAEEVNFSVIPAEVRIANLPPGESEQFNLTIHNKDEIAHNFTVSAFSPPEEERREGTAEFPDDSWISFSSPRIEIAPNSQANVMVTTAIPGGQKWAGQHWETWLAVTAESSDLLSVKLHVRLLVSTVRTGFNAGLIAAIAVAVVLLGFGGYSYFRHRAKAH
ncbi:MAG: hypothetical protein OEU97_04160 [Dehalococcoidia bacterium]|nr:hypothetical protein [Dehalococcoidia bacterium]MDH4367808.1 hypothetical protein [Dehalococcoidia bacterium]